MGGQSDLKQVTEFCSRPYLRGGYGCSENIRYKSIADIEQDITRHEQTKKETIMQYELYATPALKIKITKL